MQVGLYGTDDFRFRRSDGGDRLRPNYHFHRPNEMELKELQGYSVLKSPEVLKMVKARGICETLGDQPTRCEN
jgi:hypothetical protein